MLLKQTQAVFWRYNGQLSRAVEFGPICVVEGD